MSPDPSIVEILLIDLYVFNLRIVLEFRDVGAPLCDLLCNGRLGIADLNVQVSSGLHE